MKLFKETSDLLKEKGIQMSAEEVEDFCLVGGSGRARKLFKLQ